MEVGRNIRDLVLAKLSPGGFVYFSCFTTTTLWCRIFFFFIFADWKIEISKDEEYYKMSTWEKLGLIAKFGLLQNPQASTTPHRAQKGHLIQCDL